MPRKAKSIDFDVSGLALEGRKLKTNFGKLKASILTSAGLLWKAPRSKKLRKAKNIDFDVSGLALEGPSSKQAPEG
jgi:hypothetical protein